MPTKSPIIQIAKEVGFQFVKKIHLSLSNLNLRDKEKKYKYEPIFVFIRKWKNGRFVNK